MFSQVQIQLARSQLALTIDKLTPLESAAVAAEEGIMQAKKRG